MIPGWVTDPGLFRWELRAVFARRWLVLAHQSEVPRPGDYVTRRLGADSVILLRHREGSLRALLNVCPHEGLPLVRPNERGRASGFRCPYHGWAFDPDGRFVPPPDAPSPVEGSTSDLSPIAVTVRSGLVLGRRAAGRRRSTDHTEPLVARLTELGDAEVAGPTHRSVVDVNWKLVATRLVGLPAATAAFPNSVLVTGAGTTEVVTVVPRSPRRSEIVSWTLRVEHGPSPPRTDLTAAQQRSGWWRTYFDALSTAPP